MNIEFDPAKDQANFEQHDLRLSDFEGFDGDPIVVEDSRFDYGERRFRAFGRIGGEPYCLVYTIRDPNLRLISFRRAHEKEIARYE
jgi:uncharacterized DUF497 family protein